MAHSLVKKTSLQVTTVAVLTILLSACAAERPGKPTRIRPDLRQKVRAGKTIDDVAPARGEQTLVRGDENGQTTDGTDNSTPATEAEAKCSLKLADNKPCDAIAVDVDAEGKIQNLSEEIKLDNLDALEIKAEELKKEGQDANGKGGTFTVSIESKKGKHVSAGKDVLYLTYVLPLKKSEVKDGGAKLEVFLNDRKLENSDEQNVVLVSVLDEKIMVRITDKAIFESINFQVGIHGEFSEEVTVTTETPAAATTTETPAAAANTTDTTSAAGITTVNN